jgi:hypothetical protein
MVGVEARSALRDLKANNMSVEQLLPDPAQQPAHEVLAAFTDGLDGTDDDELAARLRGRAQRIFEQREIAADALGASLVLVDWMRRDVLPLLSIDLAQLPPASDFGALDELNQHLAVHERDAQGRWDVDGEDSAEQWLVFSTVSDLHRAVMRLRRIPKYRVPDPNWKAKQPRPTPASICAEAASILALAFVSAAADMPDIERALDWLGLGGKDSRRERVEHARRALDQLGVEGGLMLLDLAERVTIACDTVGDFSASELADRALDGFAHESVAAVAESPQLCQWPLQRPASTVAEAAVTTLRALTIHLAELLLANAPTRRAEPRGPSMPTPVETPAPRPTPEDRLRRITTSLSRGRRDPRAALAAMSELGPAVPEHQRRTAAEMILDHLTGDVTSKGARQYAVPVYARLLSQARFKIGAVEGAMLVPIVEHSLAHLWRSTGTDDLSNGEAVMLCGSRILAGVASRRLYDDPSSRSSYSDHFIFDYAPNRAPCAACLTAARADGPYPTPIEPLSWPPELRKRAVDTVLCLDATDEAWRWDKPLTELIQQGAHRQAAADAEQMSVLCAQRTLGPARYLKEQARLSAPLGVQLTREDWATLLVTADISVPKRLVELARERQDDPPRGSGRGGAPSWDEHFDALRAYYATHGHTVCRALMRSMESSWVAGCATSARLRRA